MFSQPRVAEHPSGERTIKGGENGFNRPQVLWLPDRNGRTGVRLTRRSAIGALTAGAWPMAVRAQDFPSRTLRIVAPLSLGGYADAVARVLQPALQEALGQGVFVENRPPAGGSPADELVARAPADGHTLLVATLADALPPRRLLGELAPISLMVVVPQLMIASPGFAPRSVGELIRLARTQPGKLTYASAGDATAQHLAATLFKLRANIDIQHIAYMAEGQALIDVAAGHVPFGFAQMGVAWPHARAGRVRALAVTGPRRSSLSPDVPTLAEAGVSGCEVQEWAALLAPAGTPAKAIARLNREVVRILAEPKVGRVLANLGGEPIGSTPVELSAFIEGEIARWAQFVETAKIRTD